MTYDEAWKSGITKLRRPEWARGEWLELHPGAPFTGDCYAINGTLHSILDTPNVPPEVRIGPQLVPLFMFPSEGWEEADRGDQ